MRTNFISILFIAFTFAFACNDKVTPAKPEKSKKLRFESIAQGYYSGLERQINLVIKDQKSLTIAWGQLYQNRDPQPKSPKLDFAKDMAVLVGMGSRKSGGYSIQIVEIRAIGDKIVVFVKEQKPGGVVTTALTQPFHLVKLGKREGEVIFRQAH